MTVTHGGMVTFNYSGQVLIDSAIGGATDIWLLHKGHFENGEESWETGTLGCSLASTLPNPWCPQLAPM